MNVKINGVKLKFDDYCAFATCVSVNIYVWFFIYPNIMHSIKDETYCHNCDSWHAETVRCETARREMNEKKPVFRNCNACGRELMRSDELAAGMCAICANEEVPEKREAQPPSDILALGYKDARGQIVVTDVLCVGVKLTTDQKAELSRKLSP